VQALAKDFSKIFSVPFVLWITSSYTYTPLSHFRFTISVPLASFRGMRNTLKVLKDVETRKSLVAKAIRDGNVSVKDFMSLQEQYAFVYKDHSGNSALGMGRSGSANLSGSTNDYIQFIITTLEEDRDGDIVVPMGRVGKNYANNPVWFFGHQEWEIPIGTSRAPDGSIAVVSQRDKCISNFYPDRADPDAMFVFGKVQRGILNATSIAFVPLIAQRREEMYKSNPRDTRPSGWRFDSWDHTETSIVGVPANAGAIRDSLDKEKSFITPRLQKALKPYAAKSRKEQGIVWSGWCPNGDCTVKKSSLRNNAPRGDSRLDRGYSFKVGDRVQSRHGKGKIEEVRGSGRLAQYIVEMDDGEIQRYDGDEIEVAKAAKKDCGCKSKAVTKGKKLSVGMHVEGHYSVPGLGESDFKGRITGIHNDTAGGNFGQATVQLDTPIKLGNSTRERILLMVDPKGFFENDNYRQLKSLAEPKDRLDDPKVWKSINKSLGGRIVAVIPIPSNYKGRRLTDADLDDIADKAVQRAGGVPSGINMEIGAAVGSRDVVTIPIYFDQSWVRGRDPDDGSTLASRAALKLQQAILSRAEKSLAESSGASGGYTVPPCECGGKPDCPCGNKKKKSISIDSVKPATKVVAVNFMDKPKLPGYGKFIVDTRGLVKTVENVLPDGRVIVDGGGVASSKDGLLYDTLQEANKVASELRGKSMKKKTPVKQPVAKSKPVRKADMDEEDQVMKDDAHDLIAEDIEMEEPFTVKPSAASIVKTYQHAKAEAEFLEDEISKLDHPGIEEGLTKYKAKYVDPRMEHLKGMLHTHHAKGEGDPDEFLDKCMKGMETDGTGGSETDPGEEGMVQAGEIPPEDEVVSKRRKSVRKSGEKFRLTKDPKAPLVEVFDASGEIIDSARASNVTELLHWLRQNYPGIQEKKSLEDDNISEEVEDKDLDLVEWAEQEEAEPEHEDVIDEEVGINPDEDTEEILERYQHPKNLKWYTRKVGTAKRVGNKLVLVKEAEFLEEEEETKDSSSEVVEEKIIYGEDCEGEDQDDECRAMFANVGKGKKKSSDCKCTKEKDEDDDLSPEDMERLKVLTNRLKDYGFAI